MSFPSSLRTEIDSAVHASYDSYIKQRNTGLPRFAFMAATSTDDNLVNSVAGVEQFREDLETAPRATEDSLYPLWSATKLFTTISVMQLVEQGRIGLDDDASKYVKELVGMKVLTGFTEDGDEPVYEEAKRSCTVQELLTHTAGFAFSYHPLVGKMEKKTGHPWVYNLEATRESLTSVPYVSQPGTTFWYGSSTDWLALLVADVTGQSFDEYLQEHLFDPLDISDMTFENPTNRVDMATAPPVPSETPDAPAPRYKFSNMDFPRSIAWGGAGLTGSPKSYLRVLRCLLLGGISPIDSSKRILRQETVDSMFEPRLEGESIMDSFMPFVTERSDPWSHKSGKQFEGVNHGLGGLLCGEGFPSGRSKGSMAWSGAANAFWVIDRQADVAFVVWSCFIPHSAPVFMNLWADIETKLYDGLERMKQ